MVLNQNADLQIVDEGGQQNAGRAQTLFSFFLGRDVLSYSDDTANSSGCVTDGKCRIADSRYFAIRPHHPVFSVVFSVLAVYRHAETIVVFVVDSADPRFRLVVNTFARSSPDLFIGRTDICLRKQIWCSDPE